MLDVQNKFHWTAKNLRGYEDLTGRNTRFEEWLAWYRWQLRWGGIDTYRLPIKFASPEPERASVTLHT